MSIGKNHGFFIILLSILYKSILNECERENPIFKDNSCQLIYCNESEFSTNICRINNEIVKTQWLTNIIKISKDSFIHINIASNSKGDIFLESSPIDERSERNFYALKSDGRAYFKNSNNEESYFYIMNELDINLKRHESELINVVLNNNEYLMSIGIDGSVEVYDFDKGERKYITALSFLGYTSSLLSTFSTSLKDGDNYCLYYPMVFYNNDYNFGGNIYFYLFKYNFNSIDISNSNSYNREISVPHYAITSKIISCFITTSKIIGCFFLHYSKKYSLTLFDNYLNYINTHYLIENDNYNEITFFKAVLLKDEIIAFYYYINSEEFGHISIKQINGKNLNIYKNHDDININKKSFFPSIYSNDFIKFNDNKLYVVSIYYEKIIYIITITLFNNDENIIIYYYIIEMFELYNYIIASDVKIFNYNNFLLFSASACKDTCSDDSISAKLIIFSYANCIDTTIDLIDYLLNRKIYINDFEINLSEYFHIDNNIFGYVFKNIKIIDLFENTSLKIIKKSEGNELTVNSELEKDEILKLYYNENGVISKGQYTIEYAGVVTEPDFNEFILYPEINDTTYQENNDYSLGFEKSNYIGKTAYYIINITDDITLECSNNCKLCTINSICLYKEEITDSDSVSESIDNESQTNDNKSGEEDKNTNTNTNTEDEANSSNLDEFSNNTFENGCTPKLIIDNKCNENINTEQINDVYEIIREDILNDNYKKEKENIIIKTRNTLFQLTQYNNQTNNESLSYVDIGICEDKIRKTFDIPPEESLIILKTDIKNEELSGTYVQYEIYNPLNLDKINLEICEDIPVNIMSQYNLTKEAILLYDNLKGYGYNLFDSNDTFYKDICSKYTSLYGTDILLSDRKQLLLDKNNISLCQENCVFISFNSSTNMTKCTCPVQSKNSTFDAFYKLFCNNRIVKSFYLTLSNSNFQIMKCYKLLFSKEGQLHNIGSYILIAINIINIILMILFFIYGRKKLKYFIEIILRKKLSNKRTNKSLKSLGLIKKNSNKKKKSQISKKKIKKEQYESDNLKLEKNNKTQPPRKKKKNELSFKSIEFNVKGDKRLNSNIKKINPTNKNIFTVTLDKSKTSMIGILNKKNEKENALSKNIFGNNNKRNLFKKNKIDENDSNSLNELDLNCLKYEKALKIDKRSFMECYWSILKFNHTIIFSFFPIEDYNLRTIKFSLLLISFSLYFTINCFFFTDKSMHKLYIELGKNKFISQIPQMIYSTLISSVLNSLLKYISLSGKNILFIKRLPNTELLYKRANQVEKCEMTKTIVFYALSIIILLFFWYYISCFCAVYVNTQYILINDTLISFSTSMIYQLGLYLLPTLLRLISLKSNQKYQNCLIYLYNISLLLS